MDLTTAVTLTRRWETRIRAASLRVASRRDYVNKLEELGLTEYAREFKSIYEAAARKAVKEAVANNNWDVEDTGDEIEKEGSFVTEILPPNRDPQEAAEITVNFTVDVLEWVDVSTSETIDISNLMGRASQDKKAVAALLKDPRSRDHIIALAVEAAQDEARNRKMAKTQVKYWEEEEKSNASVSVDGDMDESDADEYWDMKYSAGALTVAPKPSFNARGELTIGVVCRLTAEVTTDNDYASTRYTPAWMKRRMRTRYHDDY